MPVTGRYEDICAQHEWRVPERYNIAADCCDKHPRDKPAMVHERFDGERRELTWGELQDLSNQAANLLGPWRLGAVQCVYQREGGFDPRKQLDFLSRNEVTNVFTTPTAMRSMMSIADAGERYPAKFRRVCSAGEPLNPQAIRWFRRPYGLTLPDHYRPTASYP